MMWLGPEVVGIGEHRMGRGLREGRVGEEEGSFELGVRRDPKSGFVLVPCACLERPCSSWGGEVGGDGLNLLDLTLLLPGLILPEHPPLKLHLGVREMR